MGFWSYVNGWVYARMKQDEEALEAHAQALLKGEQAEAARLQAQARPELASLMALAQELSLVLVPIRPSAEARERLRARIVPARLSRRERLGNAVREHGKEAFVGAAVLGTAFSLGRVALHYYRKRHPQEGCTRSEAAA